jgi:hypothetical protein
MAKVPDTPGSVKGEHSDVKYIRCCMSTWHRELPMIERNQGDSQTGELCLLDSRSVIDVIAHGVGDQIRMIDCRPLVCGSRLWPRAMSTDRHHAVCISQEQLSPLSRLGKGTHRSWRSLSMARNRQAAQLPLPHDTQHTIRSHLPSEG